MPSVGYVLILATFLSWVKVKLPRAIGSVTIIFVVIMGLYTTEIISRNNDWKNSFNLWSDTVKKAPDSPEAHSNLGLAYASQNLLDRAIEQYQIALRLKPDLYQARQRLNEILSKQH